MPASLQDSPAPTETCTQCGGSGWRTLPASGDKPQSVVKCQCRVGNWTERLLKKARIPARYEHCTLSNFDSDFPGANRSLAAALFQANRFVEEYPVETTGLMLLGPIGVGKTHLAVGVLRELVLQKNASCLFYDYRELLKEIQNSYNATVQTTELEILKPVFETEVLVLDELGAVKPTEWVWDTVSHILNTRYNDKRTTIITTNFDDLPPGRGRTPLERTSREDTLGDRIGERMRSRLREMCRVIEMQGSDFRQNIRRARSQW
ncbi:MAG: ATP-binding protein [Acidobacteria bacterium]|nr:ATP-binding protein [Acidobacteriota bacterium]